MFVGWLAKMTDNKVTETTHTQKYQASRSQHLLDLVQSPGPIPSAWPHTHSYTQISWLAQGHDVFIMPSAIFVLFLCFFVFCFVFRTDGGALPRDMSPESPRNTLGHRSEQCRLSSLAAKGSNFVLWPTSGARKSKGVTTGQKVQQGQLLHWLLRCPQLVLRPRL